MTNQILVPYGIKEERSDIRAHVCVNAKRVYAYPTQSGLAAIETGKYRKAPAFTGAIKTAEGYLVPPSAITFCRDIAIPKTIWDKAQFLPTDSTTEKGDKAVRVVRWMLRCGMFPLWAASSVVDDLDMQIEGTDIIVKMTARIQVKCDLRGGIGEGCTGNLFLQVAECNPFGRH